MRLVTVGSVAFDAIETPFGKTDKLLVVPEPLLPFRPHFL